MTGSESGERGNSLRILIAIILLLHEVTSSKTILRKGVFFINSDYMTFCDLQGHRRSDALVQNERLYNYEFIYMNNCNYRPIWHPY